jgi:hypothetical protein
VPCPRRLREEVDGAAFILPINPAFHIVVGGATDVSCPRRLIEVDCGVFVPCPRRLREEVGGVAFILPISPAFHIVVGGATVVSFSIRPAVHIVTGGPAWGCFEPGMPSTKA